MTSDDSTRAPSPVAHLLVRLRDRMWAIASRALVRVAPPYARYRARQAEMADALARLSADVEYVRKRHTEQIERLEELVRELALSAEALRRDIARKERGDES